MDNATKVRGVLAMAVVAAAVEGCGRRAPQMQVETHHQEEHEAKPDEPLAAARFRHAQRRSADGTIPPNALMNAKRHRDRMIEHQAALEAQSGIAGNVIGPQWTWAGPGNIGGRIRAIIIHPG